MAPMQLNRSNLAPLGVVGVILAVAIGGFLFNQVLSPSTAEDFCALRTPPRDNVEDGFQAANITEEFLDEWPLLRNAIQNHFVYAPLEAAHEVIRAIEDLGATTRGHGDPGLRTYAIYQNQVYHVVGSCPVP